MKIEAFLSDEPKKCGWTWEVQEVAFFQGHPFPKKSALITYQQSADSPDRQAWQKHEVDVTRVRFNEPYPASTFWPAISAGTVVNDGIVGKRYVRSGVKQVEQKEPVANSTATVKPVFDASPARGWSTLTAASMSIIGLALLLFGSFLWVRRR